MNSSLEADLQRLQSLAYHRAQWGEALIRKFHRLSKNIRQNPDFPLLEKLRGWLLAPITLWPSNLEAIGWQAVEMFQNGRSLDQSIRLALELLVDPPSEEACEAATRHEHDVQQGRYEHLIHATCKLNEIETERTLSDNLMSDWKRLRKLFDVRKFADHKGIIRRRLVQERSLRNDWDIDWRKEEDRFYAIFNVFCHRWHLYGMQGDKPLALKMTVNLTPFGTMIFIPAYWSFDPKRDLKWRAITALHRARGVVRQGEKLSQNRSQRRDEAERAKRLVEQAKARGLKGFARAYWVMGQLNWDPRTDISRLKRLLKTV